MRLIRPLLVSALLAALVPVPAIGAEIYLNGVRVTGLRTRTIERCKVTFDAQGNVHITAPGYRVRAVDPASGKTRTPRAARKGAKRRYFLVSTGHEPRLAQYEVDVYVNDRWVAKVRGAGQDVRDVTALLRPGRNVVRFVAVKRLGKRGRLSRSPAHFIRVLLGAGTRGGGTLTIDESLAEVRAAADRTDTFSHEVLVTVPKG